jgi:hypothetical protein
MISRRKKHFCNSIVSGNSKNHPRKYCEDSMCSSTCPAVLRDMATQIGRQTDAPPRGRERFHPGSCGVWCMELKSVQQRGKKEMDYFFLIDYIIVLRMQ